MSRVKVDMVPIAPSPELLQARSCLIGELADYGRVEERLNLNSSREIELLRF
jgi:hypothetical protein